MPETLLAGQVGDPTLTLPSGKGAKLYKLSTGTFGQQVTSTGGIDSPLRIEGDDYPLVSNVARVIVRRLYVRVGYSTGQVVLTITPVIDFFQGVAPKSFTLSPGTSPRVRVLEVEMARAASYLRPRVDVLSRAGPFELLGWWAAHVPLEDPAVFVAGDQGG